MPFSLKSGNGAYSGQYLDSTRFDAIYVWKRKVKEESPPLLGPSQPANTRAPPNPIDCTPFRTHPKAVVLSSHHHPLFWSACTHEATYTSCECSQPICIATNTRYIHHLTYLAIACASILVHAVCLLLCFLNTHTPVLTLDRPITWTTPPLVPGSGVVIVLANRLK